MIESTPACQVAYNDWDLALAYNKSVLLPPFHNIWRRLTTRVESHFLLIVVELFSWSRRIFLYNSSYWLWSVYWEGYLGVLREPVTFQSSMYIAEGAYKPHGILRFKCFGRRVCIGRRRSLSRLRRHLDFFICYSRGWIGYSFCHTIWYELVEHTDLTAFLAHSM